MWERTGWARPKHVFMIKTKKKRQPSACTLYNIPIISCMPLLSKIIIYCVARCLVGLSPSQYMDNGHGMWICSCMMMLCLSLLLCLPHVGSSSPHPWHRCGARGVEKTKLILSNIGVCTAKCAIIFSAELLFGHWEVSPRVHMPPRTKGPYFDISPLSFMQAAQVHSAVFFFHFFFQGPHVFALLPCTSCFPTFLVLSHDYPKGVFPMVR